MPDLLIEIGVEELPASFLTHALASMESAAADLLKAHRLQAEAIQPLGTPRRLALRLAGLPAAQPDREETVQGPPWSVAFQGGEPTKAAEGFAKKNGVAVAELKKVETDKGEYVAAHVHEKGQPTSEVLAELLPQLCERVRFPKSMRWGEGEHAFGRPVHWLVALLDGAVVPFEWLGLTAGRTSRGHRFLAPGEVELGSAASYEMDLRKARVMVDIERRRARMEEALAEAAKKLGGELIPDDFLVGECVHLVEEPFVVPGTFDEVFLELPDEVVISVMRDHQRYFAVRAADGSLMSRYLNVVNTANDPERIARGNDRVLRARLADARFFVEEDRKQPLHARRPKLDSVVFQRKLGSIGQKVERLANLAQEAVAGAEHVHLEDAKIVQAAELAKCDLETLIVFEFPELQGQMGRFYAEREGIDAGVALAIEEHYKPAGASDDVPTSVLGAVLAVADRVDTLVGCFGIGQQPKGNADPFGLRRAALGVIRIALEGPLDVDLAHWLARAAAVYATQGHDFAKSRAALDGFFDGRLKSTLGADYPSDVVDAALSAWREAGAHSIRDLRERVDGLMTLRGTAAYEALAHAFKRVFNIAGEHAPGELDDALLTEGAEQDLAAVWAKAGGAIDAATAKRDYATALELVATELKDPVDRFFDDVLVMDEDEALRANRLTLLARIAHSVSRIVHFHKLQPQG